MKKTCNHPNLHLYSTKIPVTPNAADDCYFADKALDLLTGIASFAGFVCAMVFLVMLA